jgi:hypothetical protein
MRGLGSGYRVRYYDAFSRVYDRFVAAHSSDREGLSGVRLSLSRHSNEASPVTTP